MFVNYRDVELYHPTFLYAYTALIVQCGVIQTIGCLGAQRLNHKLLSVYWVLLLLLTIGDVVVGLFWVFKLDKVKLSLRPSLTHEFKTRYSSDPGFTQVWNLYQAQEHCCGVNGPLDFDKFSPDIRSHVFSGGYGGQMYDRSAETGSTGLPFLNLPESCCTMRVEPFPVSIPISTQNSNLIIRNKTSKRDISKISSSENLTSSRAAAQTLSPLALFLSVNFSGGRGVNSGEESSSSLPSLVGNKVRHYTHQRKKIPPKWVPGQNSSGLSSNGTTNETFHFLPTDPSSSSTVNTSATHPEPSLNTGTFSSTEEPSEVTEITVPFTCRSPEKHFITPLETLSRGRRSLFHVMDDEEDNDDEDSSVGSGSGAGNPNPLNDIDAEEKNGENIDLQDKTTTKLRREREKDDKNPKPRHVFDSATSPYHQGTLATSSSSSIVPSSNHKYHHQVPKYKIRVYRNGCVLKLMQWLDHVSGILFILGFCIIGFIKVCFLIILRYEIREMIEKIHILETDAKSGSVTSPSRSRGGSLGGNMLLKQYSTQSGSATQVVQPFTGITIKSPQGDGGPSNYCNSIQPSNHTSNQHYLHQHQQYGGRGGRRQSARSLGEGIRSTSHSQETVNLTLLITTSNGGEAGQYAGPNCSNSNKDKNGDAEETISLKVPTPEEREAKRSNFANYCTWESNVSGDSSASGAYCSSYEHCCCPAETGTTSCSHHAAHPGHSNGRTEVVHVEMENFATNRNSSFEERSSGSSLRKEDTVEESCQAELIELLPLSLRTSSGAAGPIISIPSPTTHLETETCGDTDLLEPRQLNWLGNKPCNESEPLLPASPSSSNPRIPLQRRNGNNNSTSTSIDLDSDFVMALIGTAV